MRIIGGLSKGVRLFQPKDKETRPLKDLTKESIFNTLIHNNDLNISFQNLSILDIFSGELVLILYHVINNSGTFLNHTFIKDLVRFQVKFGGGFQL